jgi:lipopolysaccharide/colanic/teichoic acid biosynthesis glycosyltransferase
LTDLPFTPPAELLRLSGRGGRMELRSIDFAEPTVGHVIAQPGFRLRYDPLFKRLLDVVLATVGLILSLPIWLIVGIAIKLDSDGSTIFVQERVGHHGRTFRFLKFRSMYSDAEDRLQDLLAENEASGPVFKIRRDPRITRVGRFIRRTSLDELPQLINILKGEMSLVGPRPALVREAESYRPADRVRLEVKPGLTCLWQVRGRSEVDFDTWMQYDREYVRRRTLLLDLEILFRTAVVVLTCRGAY